jgi:outer membrane protein TolC
MFHRHIVPVLVFSVIVMSSAFAQAPATITFPEFYQKVLQHYPKLKANGADVELALARRMQTTAGFWPSVSVSAGYTETNDPVSVFGMKMRHQVFTSSDFNVDTLNSPGRHRDLEAGVHLDWVLFDAMRTIRNAQAGRAGVRAAKEEETFTRMEAYVIAQDAFAHALSLEAMYAAADEAGKASQEDLKKADELKDKGMVLGADFYSAKTLAGNFTKVKNELGRQRTAMGMLLNTLMGETPTREIVVQGELPKLAAEVKDVQAHIEMAMKSRPDLMAFEARIEAARATLSREKSSVLPQLKAFGDVTNNRGTISDRGGDNFAVGLKADLAVFDPARSGRRQEASFALKRLENERDSLRDTISRDIVQEIAQFEALRENIPVVEGMAEDSAQAVGMVLPLYNEGRKSIADLEAIREAHLNAVLARETTRASAATSEARLYFLTGKTKE